MGTSKGTQSELKSSISGTYQLKTEERRRTMKNGGKPSQNRPRKRLGSVTEAPRLGFSSRKQFFSLILSDSQIPVGFNIFVLPSSPYLQGKRGWWLPPSSPRRAGLLPPEGTAFCWNPQKAQVGLVAICTPFLLNTPAPSFFADSFSLMLWNFMNYVTIFVFCP